MAGDTVGLEDAGIAVAVGSVVYDLIEVLDTRKRLSGEVKALLAPALSGVITGLIYVVSAIAEGGVVPVAKIFVLAFGSYGKSQQSYVVAQRKGASREAEMAGKAEKAEEQV